MRATPGTGPSAWADEVRQFARPGRRTPSRDVPMTSRAGATPGTRAGIIEHLTSSAAPKGRDSSRRPGGLRCKFAVHGRA